MNRWQSNSNGHHSWQMADPVCTFLFSLVVLATTIRLLKANLHVLMEGTPASVDFSKVLESLETIPGVDSVHDLHIWSLSTGTSALSAHLCLDSTIQNEHSYYESVLVEAQSRLRNLSITHTCIQVKKIGPKNKTDFPQVERTGSNLECLCESQDKSVVEISLSQRGESRVVG